MPTPSTELVLNARRQAAVAFLGYAYLAAVRRGSPAASALHAQFVRWYVANRGLFAGDANVRAMEGASGTRLTALVGYTAMTGYALRAVFVEMGELTGNPRFVQVWSVAAPATQAALPQWMDAQGFMVAATFSPNLNALDVAIERSQDPVRAAEAAGTAVSEYINTGALPRFTAVDIPAVTPGQASADDNAKPFLAVDAAAEAASGATWGGAAAAQNGAITPSGSYVPLNTTSSTNLLLGAVGAVAAGAAIYYLVKRVQK